MPEDAEMTAEKADVEPKEAEKAPEPPKELEEDAPKDKRAKLAAGSVEIDMEDASVNVMPSCGGKVLMSLGDGGFQYLCGAARVNAGIKTGRYLFEVKIVEIRSLFSGSGNKPPGHFLRIGVSCMDQSFFMGENSGSVCFDSEGNVVQGKWKTRRGKPFEAHDVIGLLVNLDPKSPNANTASLFVNGVRWCQPEPLPEAIRGKVLYPTLNFKNMTLHVNSGPSCLAPLPFECRMLQDAANADIELTKPRSGKKELLMPVGIPDEGTFRFVDGFLEEHPAVTELSDRAIVHWAKSSGVWLSKGYSQSSNDKPGLDFGIREMEESMLRRSISTAAAYHKRSYMIMEVKNNLLAEERKKALSQYDADSFKKVAVVAMGEPPAAFKEKLHKEILEKKKWMVAGEVKRKHLQEKRQREAEKAKAAKEKAEKEKQAAKEKAEKEKQEKVLKMRAEAAEKAEAAKKAEEDKKAEEEKKAEEKEATIDLEDGEKKEAAIELDDDEKKQEKEGAVDLDKEDEKKEEEKADEPMADGEEEKKEEEPAADEPAADEPAAEDKEAEEAEEPEESLDDAIKKAEEAVELTDEEKALWFPTQETLKVLDIAAKDLSASFSSFSVPTKDEGFDEIRFVWAKQKASEEYLQAWIKDRKLHSTVEDLEPGAWFIEQRREWTKLYDGWRTRQNDWKNPEKRKKMKKAKVEEKKKEEGEAEEKEEKDKEEGEDKENKENKEKKESEDKDEAMPEEEEIDAGDIDAFDVEDINDIGSGEPIFANFSSQDWTLLALRFNLHLLVHAFAADMKDKDPERTAFHESHVGFYYKKYFRTDFEPKYYSRASFIDVLELMPDVIEICENNTLGPLMSDDCPMDNFVRLTEDSRRERQKLIDAGDESAVLKFSQRPPGEGYQGRSKGDGKGGKFGKGNSIGGDRVGYAVGARTTLPPTQSRATMGAGPARMPVGRAAYGTAPPPARTGYGQGAYGQPPPAYGHAPPPAYGSAPRSGYTVPPPAYGAPPPPAYGAPAGQKRASYGPPPAPAPQRPRTGAYGAPSYGRR